MCSTKNRDTKKAFLVAEIVPIIATTPPKAYLEWTIITITTTTTVIAGIATTIKLRDYVTN